MSTRYEVVPWVADPPAGGWRGRALVLPGRDYTAEHSALYWGRRVLAQAGWRVVTMRWNTDGLAYDDFRTFVEDGAQVLDDAAGEDRQTLILGKSLGTVAAGWASIRRYPAIWLTPVMSEPLVAGSLRTYSAPSLLIGGTADRWWNTPRVKPRDQVVVELPGVDHALVRPGSWRESLTVLQTVLTSIEDFSRSLLS